MARPEKTERFKVTERDANAVRVSREPLPNESPEGEPLHLAACNGEGCGDSSFGLMAGVSDMPSFEMAQDDSSCKTDAVIAREQQLEMRGMCGNDEIMFAVEAIRNHPDFIDHMKRIARAETDRLYCKHGIEHLLDVARIAYIRLLERKMPFRKEVVYAAALLHDVGKAEQYEYGEAHEVAGARVAAAILMDIDGFSALEKTAIVASVAQHRRYDENSSPLGKLLFEADKASRACFSCSQRSTCAWPEEKMNLGVKL